MRTGTSLRGQRGAAALLAGWLLLLLVGSLLFRFGPGWLRDPEAIRAFFLGFGVLAPAAFVAVQALQVVVAPVPGQVLGFAAGYLFGAVFGTALSILGASIGTYVAVVLSRRYGRPLVERLVDPETVDHFDAAVDRRGLVALFVVFLVPGLPDDAICLAAGLTRLDVRQVVIVSALGRLPGYALVALAGARLAGGRSFDTAVLLGVLVSVSLLVYLAREPIGRWLAGDEPATDGTGGIGEERPRCGP